MGGSNEFLQAGPNSNFGNSLNSASVSDDLAYKAYKLNTYKNGTSEPLSYDQWKIQQSLTDFLTKGLTPGITNAPATPMVMPKPMKVVPGSVPKMSQRNSSDLMMQRYAAAPFAAASGTPKVNPNASRGLTYLNPYNTNPYLPTANPFALVANTPTSGQ